MKVTDVSLDKKAQANFRGRFLMLVDQTGNGCWPWKGPRHSSGRGRYLWRSKDGGDDKYLLASRVAYYLATGELPRYLRSLCGNKLCCKPSHWWSKQTVRFKQKPRRAIRGRIRQLSDSDVRSIRLLATLSEDEDEIGKRFGLTRRQVADIAMGKVRPEAGGRIRSSRHRGIRHYHAEFERELDSLRPEPPVVVGPPVRTEPHPSRPSSTSTISWPVPRLGRTPYRAYGQRREPRLLRTRW